MTTAPLVAPSPPESLFDIGKRLAGLLEQAEQDAFGGQLPDAVRERLADAVEALRLRVVRKTERDPHSLLDIDERLIELMDQAEEALAGGGEISQELLQEINDYLEAFKTKVDRIAGYWRWQESVAEICGKEAERLEARKRAAEGRLCRLKGMLLAFMMSRGLKKLEGDKAAIGMQANGSAALVIEVRRRSGSASSRTASGSRRRSFRNSSTSWRKGSCVGGWRLCSQGTDGRSTVPLCDSPSSIIPR